VITTLGPRPARGRRPTGARRPSEAWRASEAWRVAAVAVLLAVTAAGLRVRGTFSHRPNQVAAGASGAALALALSAAEGLALIAFIVVLASARPQRKPKPDDPQPPRPAIPWWAKTLGALLAVAAMITPFVVLFTQPARKTPAQPLPGPAGGARQLTGPASGASSVWPVIAGMVIAIAVVLALAVLSRRRRRAGAPPRDRAGRGRARLASALAAASDALTAGGEPRAAIIACYLAMERGFADAGSAPAAADTPAEVLTRATDAGLVRSGSAEALAGLFRRARYSSQPMTSADSAAAGTALARMRADLSATASTPLRADLSATASGP
jgi:Domain of unknown function (DUF4129)